MTPHSNIEHSHLIGQYVGYANGPTLMIFGSVHGNEIAGKQALIRVSERLRNGEFQLSGRIYFFVGNRRAVEKGVRFIDSDLNRHWTAENIERNTNGRVESGPGLSEDREQAELLASIIPILETANDEVYAVDLHSTSAEGVPFATVGDTLRNRAFAQKFPVTILLGIEEQLEGTLLEFLNNQGAVTLGYEGGQHFAATTIETHEALVWRALVNAGIIEERTELRDFHERLKTVTGRPRIVEIRYRHAITEESRFEMLPGFTNFDPIRKRQLLAKDAHGKVAAGESGLMLMPLYQKLGEDGFFIGREVSPFWIWLSGVLRRLHVGNIMHLLPGVSETQNNPDVLLINTTVARFFPLQIFHLLGFRKLRWVDRFLVVSRRKFDTFSPFVRRATETSPKNAL
ncbi:MAG TPA: succinylglutamate desuccinylase/aspartoacylase family protein [Pyrinomonadaceae bacterium]|nr:succinylglutamate desuccinylase/aspartoacylase family protein [Pyrinomonadaceae bacterium]